MSYKQLKEAVNRDQQRKQKAEQERSSLMQATRLLGAMGLLFVLPVVGGAYLGVWLDGFSADYSVRWTIGCLLLGIVVGTINIYLIMRE